jgi:DNA-binding NarL/FixJ family response regulator
MTTVVLADDHNIVRYGLRLVLEAEPDFHIVGEAANGIETLQLVERLQPDLLVLDLMMPDMNGIDTLRHVRQRSPRTCIVILSMYTDKFGVLEALRNGAVGYVLKSANASDLIHALREATAGRRYLSPPLSEWVIEAYVQKTHSSALDRYETLTSRERDVLRLIAGGYKSVEIAARLFISPRTVETHRTHLMKKLSLRTRTDLIRYALERGLIQGERWTDYTT